MKLFCHKPKRKGQRECGQVLILFICFAVVLLLFVGLGIDLGFAYLTQARLSKAIDSAALAGMNNLYRGSNQAIAIAQATFAANFAPNTNSFSPGYVTGTPSPSVSFSNAPPDVILNVSAYATNRSFFIGMLGYHTLAVANSAQATRLPLIMTLVLDRSGSMDPTCSGGPGAGCTYGGTYLPNAVLNFIKDFDPVNDQAAVITFASTWTNDVPMTTSFQTAIPKAITNIVWDGGTCSMCGLTNALLLEQSVGSVATSVKAVVFFTDGLANMIEQNLSCPSSGAWNFGGYQGGSGQWAGFWHTNDAVKAGNNDPQNNPTCIAGGSGCCSQSATYRSYDGSLSKFSMDNVIDDATNRCIRIARQMQAAGMYVFCVGLDGGGIAPPTADFLQTVANDPSNANPDHYDPSLPAGVAYITGDGKEVNELFQLVAGQIQLRLTR